MIKNAAIDKNLTKNSLESACIYGEEFYEDQIGESYIAAKKYINILSNYYEPKSVVDVGCGRGAWLKAFKEAGAKKVVGYDGNWNSQEQMIDKNILFYPVDLNLPIKGESDCKFDLAISLEVAEHLEINSSSSFVDTLVNLSDVVLFSAAYTKQGGTNHINEQPHSYWANIFQIRDYIPFDLFRPIVWGDAEIPYWYQQNTFLYLRNNSAQYQEMLKKISPIKNLEFMNCVHPALFSLQTDYLRTTKQLVAKNIPKDLLAIAIKIKRMFR